MFKTSSLLMMKRIMVIKNTKIVIITIKMKRLAKSYNSLIMKTTHT